MPLRTLLHGLLGKLSLFCLEITGMTLGNDLVAFPRDTGLAFLNLMVNFYCFSDLELKPVGILEVKLVQAKELTNKDMIGKSDPYAVLYIRPLRDRMKTSKIIVSHITPLLLHPLWSLGYNVNFNCFFFRTMT